MGGSQKVRGSARAGEGVAERAAKFKQSMAAAADLSVPSLPSAEATGRNTEPGRKRRPVASQALKYVVGGLVLAAGVEGFRLGTENLPTDGKALSGVPTGNPFSEQHKRAMALSKERGKIRRRDPQGAIVLFPGVLNRLYWPPGEEKKDRLTDDDVVGAD